MSASTEMPGVNAALQRLQELAERMKSEEFGFRDNDITMIDGVSEAIKELDAERVKLHMLLETETINSSILRHQLQFFPDQIKKEIMAALESARQSNADELKNLQDKLQLLNETIDDLEETHKKLSKENAILAPERDMVRAQHEEVISQLNQRLADKAGKQIMLNETRDHLRETNQKIVDLETGIVILKEDMIQERSDARQEKKRLKQAVHDTAKKTKKQKEANIAQKKQVDLLQEQLTAKKLELNDILKVIRRFDTNRTRSEAQEKLLQDQLDKELVHNEQMKDEGIKLSLQLTDLETKTGKKEAILQTKVTELERDITKTNKQYDGLKAEHDEKKVIVEEALEVAEKEGSKVQEIDNILQSKKDDLTKKATDTARMKLENDEMEMKMKNLEENHQITVQLLTKQIQDFRENLTRERKERFELQEKRDALSRELEDFRQEFAKYMSTMSDRINRAKQDHVDLTNEGEQLTKDIAKDDITIKTLEKDLKKAEGNFSKVKKKLHDEIANIENKIADAEATLEAKMKELEEKTPIFEELERMFEEKQEEYNNKKKGIVELKNKKSVLMTSSNRAQREIQKLIAPGPENETEEVALRHLLKQQRSAALGRMKEQGRELQELEENIFHAGRKLKAVTEENVKFTGAIEKMKKECVSIEEQISRHSSLEESLKHLVISQRGHLEVGWEKDKALQDEFAKRDQVFLDDITDLCRRADRREQVVSDITDKLQQEILMLASLLETVAERRPPNTSQGSRPTTVPRPPTVLREYLDSRTNLTTQAGRKTELQSQPNLLNQTVPEEL
ncbi:centromere-associated protein E-like isoform X4 [Lytechinus variegatus]|uniref:centromere-associated protein E-like isoform X4 n=1 Tax=Lytechinus variegatus TaxID=7654 RepID=UPI001BB2A562|nr:centromere-associated protein E-like isoform X4 [Lytechinus variegatus]